MGLDIYFHLIHHPRKRKESESLTEYLDKVTKTQSNKLKKECKAYIDKWMKLNCQDTSKPLPNYLVFEFRNTLLKKYFYEYEVHALEDAKTIDDINRWLKTIRWDWFGSKPDGYFRKVNCVYRYFEDRLEDEACLVTYKDLCDLMNRATRIIQARSKEVAEDLLPTRSGFFFGGTDYDEWYYVQMKEILEQCSKMLLEFTDPKDIMYVCMSW